MLFRSVSDEYRRGTFFSLCAWSRGVSCSSAADQDGLTGLRDQKLGEQRASTEIPASGYTLESSEAAKPVDRLTNVSVTNQCRQLAAALDGRSSESALVLFCRARQLCLSNPPVPMTRNFVSALDESRSVVWRCLEGSRAGPGRPTHSIFLEELEEARKPTPGAVFKLTLGVQVTPPLNRLTVERRLGEERFGVLVAVPERVLGAFLEAVKDYFLGKPIYGTQTILTLGRS